MKKVIFNIGRQYGSGGKSVALAIGRKLGIEVYDNELLMKAAEASGFSKEFFTEKDEKMSTFPMSGLFSSYILGTPQNYLNGDALFKIQSSVIADIAEKGPAIIVGRCADYILRDSGCTVNIFITAPEDVRIATVSERLGISPEKAKEKIAKVDKARETYYNYFTFGNWGVASNYDICVDASILGIDKTADFIIDFAKMGGFID